MQRGLNSTTSGGRGGEWRVTRTGDVGRELVVAYQVSGDGVAGRDFTALPGKVTIPAGARTAQIPLTALSSTPGNRTVVISLATGQRDFFVGCPSQSLVVIQK